MIVFFLPLRSTFDHSFGRIIVWIQDHIMVHHHRTNYFPCSHKTCGLTSFFPPFFRELGRQRSTIELDTSSMKPAQLQTLEESINEKIRGHIPVNVQLLSIDDPAVEKVFLSILCVMVLKQSSYSTIIDSNQGFRYCFNTSSLKSPAYIKLTRETDCVCTDVTLVVCLCTR